MVGRRFVVVVERGFGWFCVVLLIVYKLFLEVLGIFIRFVYFRDRCLILVDGWRGGIKWNK